MEKDLTKTIDLVIFMGQSNMAGRGVAAEAPIVPRNHGYEFRAISDATKLYDIIEPFGREENNPLGITEPGMKTGSLVSAFVEAYYQMMEVPIVGVSASKGGSSINEWQPNSPYLNDAIMRFNMAQTYLSSNGFNIKRKFMVWCQGETDCGNISGRDYQIKMEKMLKVILSHGIEKCFIIGIGNNRDFPGKHDEIQKAQIEFCNTHKEAILVSNYFAKLDPEKMMKDSLHYKQKAYNIVGVEAGKNTACYFKNNK